jgi:hypothetical protein
MEDRLRTMYESVRFPLFRTPIEGWPFATNVGTIFLVNFLDRTYAVFPKHIARNFDLSDLLVTSTLTEVKAIGLNRYLLVRGASEQFESSDIEDLCIGVLPETVKASDFQSTYPLSDISYEQPQQGDRLTIFGFIKDESFINENTIQAAYQTIEVSDFGPYGFDTNLRVAFGEFQSEVIRSVKGMSGAPVFNNRTKAVCGIVLRGDLKPNGDVSFYYLEGTHVVNTLVAGILGADKVQFITDDAGQRRPVFTRRVVTDKAALLANPQKYLSINDGR